jgi:radical SAM superfamily enzyme YgiQ (UPF0313 family)
MKVLGKKLKVCLINPPTLSVLEPWYDTPDFVRSGLLYIAGYLRKEDLFDISVIDAKFERLDFTQTCKRIAEIQPDIVGLTAYTNEVKPAAFLAHLVKKSAPNITTVIGGPHVTAIPEDTLKEFSSFDIGVIGEGEITFYDICYTLLTDGQLTKENLSTIDGVIFRDGNSLVQTPGRERILDQDSIPFPAWDMLPAAKTYYIQSQRGCPFNCLFCMNPNGRVARKRSVENVMEEIKWVIKNFKPQRISFGDELFTVDIPRTLQLLKAMTQQGIGDIVRWDVQTHVHYVNEELFFEFRKAKVERVELGVETGDEELLRRMGKGTNLNTIKAAFASAKKAGVKTGSFFLFGQPNETIDTIRKTISLAVLINPDLPMFGLMTPYPGTEISRMAAKEQGGYKILSTDWDEYNKQIGGALEFAGLTRRQIEWLQIKAYLKVYLWNFRFVDLLAFIWGYRKAAWEVMVKISLNRKSIVKHIPKPEFYDEYFRSAGQTFNKANFEKARDNWNEFQKNELRRANLSKHGVNESL